MNRFYPHPRTYSGLEELCAKEIKRWTGLSDARLVITGEGRFRLEDANMPDNPEFQRFIGIVDPHADIDLYDISSSTIFYVDDDDYTGKIIVIATDGSNGLSTELFGQLVGFYYL